MSDKKMTHQQTGIDQGKSLGSSDPNRIISQKLKALYSAVEQEGIPDRFLSLLEQLDEAERRQKLTEESDE